MHSHANISQFFYKNEKLVIVSQGTQCRSIFRTADLSLAEKHNGHGLLAIDEKGTVFTVYCNEDEEGHAFSAYGHDASIRSAATLIGFNGELIEPLMGHYLLGRGYRSYYPALMRFLSPDTLSPFKEGGFNCYAYCSGDPVNYLDPSGHMGLSSSKTKHTPKERDFIQRRYRVAAKKHTATTQSTETVPHNKAKSSQATPTPKSKTPARPTTVNEISSPQSIAASDRQPKASMVAQAKTSNTADLIGQSNSDVGRQGSFIPDNGNERREFFPVHPGKNETALSRAQDQATDVKKLRSSDRSDAFMY